MKGTDIRIGDLALVDGDIKQINLPMLHVMYDEDGEERIKPLPLSDEIMEYLGFFRGLYGDQARDEDPEAVVRWHNGSLMVSHTPSRGFYIEISLQPFLDHVPVKYAHTLQQMYSIIHKAPITTQEDLNSAKGWIEVTDKQLDKAQEGEG